MECCVRKNGLSGPRCITESPLEHENEMGGTLTFTVNPKQRARPFPFRERVSVEKPFRASLVVGLTCNVIIL
jgi:hypothetical protein